MFLRQLVKATINTGFTRSYIHRPRKNTAGIRRQKSLLQDLDELIEDPEDFGSLEGDFTKLHETHREYEQEVADNKVKVDHLMIRDKYFRTQTRNFLTWAEKEQIRNLYKEDPETWSFERLSECFPATPGIIARIAKAKWKPDSLNNIEKHDNRVKKSWELFKAKQLSDLDPEMKRHLCKFSHRNYDSKAQQQSSIDQVTFQLPKPKSSEFASIITSCKVYAEPHKEITDGRIENEKFLITSKNKETILPKKPVDDTYVLDKVVDRKHKKFDDLPESVTKLKPAAKELDMMPPKNGTDNDLVQDTATIDLAMDKFYDPMAGVQKYQTKQMKVAKMKADINTLQKQEIREKIYIPKKLYKKGATYKLYDCFYDHDGLFLYRVPGMMG